MARRARGARLLPAHCCTEKGLRQHAQPKKNHHGCCGLNFLLLQGRVRVRSYNKETINAQRPSCVRVCRASPPRTTDACAPSPAGRGGAHSFLEAALPARVPRGGPRPWKLLSRLRATQQPLPRVRGVHDGAGSAAAGRWCHRWRARAEGGAFLAANAERPGQVQRARYGGVPRPLSQPGTVLALRLPCVRGLSGAPKFQETLTTL